MASSSSSSSDEEKGTQQEKSSAAKGKKSNTKDAAYSRVEQAKQAAQSKIDDGVKSKATKSKSPPVKNNKESAKAGSSEKKKSTPAKQKTEEDDTVFVSEQPAPFNGTDERERSPSTEASTQHKSSKPLAPSVSLASDTLDEDIENLDDDFHHFTNQDQSTDYTKDDSKTADASSSDTSSMQDLRTTSISSSMIEVEKSKSSRDSTLSSTSSAFEKMQNVPEINLTGIKGEARSVDGNGNEEKEDSSSSSDDANEKPLSECQVDDGESAAKEEETEEASVTSGLLRKYWCYLLFSPFIIGNVLTVGKSLIKSIH